MPLMTDAEAHNLIYSLFTTGWENRNADCSEDEINIEIAEANTDTAIRGAWKALTGKDLQGDPVDFVYGKNPQA